MTDLIDSPAENAQIAREMIEAVNPAALHPERGDMEAAISDAIANLLHLAEAESVNPLAQMRKAAQNYLAERELTPEQRQTGDIGRDWTAHIRPVFTPDGVSFVDEASFFIDPDMPPRR